MSRPATATAAQPLDVLEAGKNFLAFVESIPVDPDQRVTLLRETEAICPECGPCMVIAGRMTCQWCDGPAAPVTNAMLSSMKDRPMELRSTKCVNSRGGDRMK